MKPLSSSYYYYGNSAESDNSDNSLAQLFPFSLNRDAKTKPSYFEGEEILEEEYRKQLDSYASDVIKEIETPDEEEFLRSASTKEDRDLMYAIWQTYASAVLSKKMYKGYVSQDVPCLKCNMPLMKYQGAINCVVCPELAKKSDEIEREFKLTKLKILEEGMDELFKAVGEAEEQVKTGEMALEKLSKMDDELRMKSRQLESTLRAETEKCRDAASKSKDANEQVEEVKTSLEEALELVQQKTKELYVCTDSIKILEQSVANIFKAEKARNDAKEITRDLVKQATDEKNQTEFELRTERENEPKLLAAVIEADERILTALTIKIYEDMKYQEAKVKIKMATCQVEEKTNSLDETLITAEKRKTEANFNLQKVSTDTARIEKCMTKKVLHAQMSKYVAENEAQRLDEELMITEVEAAITYKMVTINEMAEGKAVDALKKLSVEKSQLKHDIETMEAMATKNDIELKKMIVEEQAAAIESLKDDLQKRPTNSKIIEGVIKVRKDLYFMVTLDFHELGSVFDVVEKEVEKIASVRAVCVDVYNLTKKGFSNVVEKKSYNELLTELRYFVEAFQQKYSYEISYWKMPLLILLACVIFVAIQSRF